MDFCSGDGVEDEVFFWEPGDGEGAVGDESGTVHWYSDLVVVFEEADGVAFGCAPCTDCGADGSAAGYEHVVFVHISCKNYPKLYNKNGVSRGRMPFGICRGPSLLGLVFFLAKKDASSFRDPGWLCQFVVDVSGTRIGESVSFMDDVLIIKQGKRFLGVPLKHVKRNGSSLVVKGLSDFSKAFELGELWRTTRQGHESDGKDRSE
jgi:hypothetical protein